MIFYQRIVVMLIVLAWCWSKASQYNDYSMWVFGVLAALIEWLAYEGGKQVGVFMVITLPAHARDKIIAEYDEDVKQTQDSNSEDNQGDSK
jgi:hypothetical protein